MSEPTEFQERPTMDCADVKDLLYLYVSGELEEDEAALVKSHLDGCPECQIALDEHEVLARTLPSGFVNRRLFYYSKNV